jgi:predicted transcriptional regulator
MNIAELKLELFRKIDNLNEADLKKIYHKFVALLDTSVYNLSEAEDKAVDQALEASKKGEIHTHEEVVKESRHKYRNLKFK